MNQYGPKKKNSEVFVENSTYNRSKLKMRIIKEEMFPYVCNECNLGSSWCGKPISLQLEHKNGISTDNRIENLCFLCPNCHSQTETYAGKQLKYKTLHTKPECVRKRPQKLEDDKLLWLQLKADPDLRILEWGWKTRLAKKIGISGQKTMGWLRRVDPQFASTLEVRL